MFYCQIFGAKSESYKGFRHFRFSFKCLVLYFKAFHVSEDLKTNYVILFCYFYKLHSEDRFCKIILSSALKIFECDRYCDG
jgi:hypothetical protein